MKSTWFGTSTRRLWQALILVVTAMGSGSTASLAQAQAENDPSGLCGFWPVPEVPDTQYMTSQTNQAVPEKFDRQTEWIAARASPENIKFLSNLGDIVDFGGNRKHWEIADRALSLLDGFNLDWVDWACSPWHWLPHRREPSALAASGKPCHQGHYQRIQMVSTKKQKGFLGELGSDLLGGIGLVTIGIATERLGFENAIALEERPNVASAYWLAPAIWLLILLVIVLDWAATAGFHTDLG